MRPATSTTDTRGTKLRIRLLGIDAPEIPHGKAPGQPFGAEAKQALERLVGKKTIRVEVYGHDRYNRILGYLFDGQVNVNLRLVTLGYAGVYRGARCEVYCRELDSAEAKAKQGKLGMWIQGKDYESPAVFRKRMRLGG